MFQDNIFLITTIILYALFTGVFLVVYKINNRNDKGLNLWIIGSSLLFVCSIYFFFYNYLEAGIIKVITTFIFNILYILSMYIIINSTLLLIGVKTNKLVIRLIAVFSISIIAYATIIKYNNAIIALVYLIILPIMQITYVFFANYRRTSGQKARWFAYSFIQIVSLILFVTYIFEILVIKNYFLGDLFFVNSTNVLLQVIILICISNVLGLTTAVNNYAPRFIDLEETFFIKVFKDSPNMIIIFDEKTIKIRFYNNIFIKKFKYRKSEVLEKMDLAMLFNNPNDYNDLINNINKDSSFTINNVELKTKDNQIIYTSFSATPLILQDDAYFIVNIVDITEEVLKRKMYHKLATFDELTKLPNRRNLYQRFAEKVASNQSFKVLLLDLDQFKKINDLYGHNKGDDTLVTISKRLMSLNDNNNLVARLGGDEFALLIDDNDEEPSSKINEIIEIFSQPVVIDDQTIALTISVGVARYPEDGKDIRVLFDKADIALYAAKKYETSKILRYQELNKNE